MPGQDDNMCNAGRPSHASEYEMRVTLTREEVIVLETICRRFSWTTATSLAIEDDGGRERDLIIDVVIKLWRAVPELDA